MDRPRRALRPFGEMLLSLAAVLGLVAAAHMRNVAAPGHVCGAAPAHCWACPAALAAALLGLGALAAARLPAPALRPARARSQHARP
jgi:hypothetical protein